MFYVYLLRCRDNSLYCGQTVDIDKRIKEHNSSTLRSAKYVRGRRPVRLVYVETFTSRSAAMKREIEIKKMRKEEKEMLIYS